MSSAGRNSISSCFQHGLQDGYLSLKPDVKGGLFPLTGTVLVLCANFAVPGGGGGGSVSTRETSLEIISPRAEKNQEKNPLGVTGQTLLK